MRRIYVLFISFLFIGIFNLGDDSHHLVLADDDDNRNYEHYREHHDSDESFKDIGEIIGWGAAITMGLTGFLFLIRRSTKLILKEFPSAKNSIISFSRLLGKHHVLIGIFALVLSMTHGISMYVGEGELDTDGIIGIISVLLMLCAVLFGSILIKNKKNKFALTAHMTLMGFSVMLGIIHILFS